MTRRVLAVLALVASAALVSSGASANPSSAVASAGVQGRAATARAADSGAAQGSREAVGRPRLTGSHQCAEAAAFTCSTLRVPLDHRDRAHGHLDLAVAAETDTAAPLGVLLILTGGPGQPGVPFVQRMSSRLAPVLADYRMVMIDQRGTGANALRCPGLQERLGASDLFVPTRAEVAACAAAIGPQRRFYSTEDTVADLDLLRRALGVHRWTLDGVSYGTYVAERYALRHPHRVARLVLDSVVPHTGLDPFVRADLRAVGRVLREVCTTRACPGDPAVDLAKVVRGRDDGSDLLNAIVILEFVFPDYRYLPEALHTAAAGDPTDLDGIVAGVREGVQTPPEDLSQGLHAATLCADGRWPWGSAAAPLRGREAAVHRAAGKIDPAEVWPFDVRTAANNGILLTCEWWPRTPTAHRAHRRLLPDVPTLLLGGSWDLSTPLAWLREEAALAPGAEVVVVPRAVHSLQSFATDDTGAAGGLRLPARRECPGKRRSLRRRPTRATSKKGRP